MGPLSPIISAPVTQKAGSELLSHVQHTQLPRPAMQGLRAQLCTSSVPSFCRYTLSSRYSINLGHPQLSQRRSCRPLSRRPCVQAFALRVNKRGATQQLTQPQQSFQLPLSNVPLWIKVSRQTCKTSSRRTFQLSSLSKPSRKKVGSVLHYCLRLEA